MTHTPTHTHTHTRARRVASVLAIVALSLVSLACCAAPETAPTTTPAADPTYSTDPVGPECLVIFPQQGADYVGASVSGTTYGTWFDATGRVIGYAAAEDSIVWSSPECVATEGAY